MSRRRVVPRLLLLCVLLASPVLRAQTFAYVVSRHDQDVLAIDLSTNTVVASIPIGPSISGASGGISISPDGTHVYATTRQTIPGGSKEFVNVIDTATNSVSASLEVPGAWHVFVSPDSARVYVATLGSGVVVMDAATNSVVGSLAIPGSARPYWVVPTATQIYVDDCITGDLYVVDAATNTLVTTIPEVPPTGPYFNAGALAMALSPDGSRLYVCHGGIRGFFSTIDTATNLHWKFEGTVAGARVNGDIKQQNKSTKNFDYSFNVNGPDLTPQPRPIRVGLRIGLHAGSALVP